MRRWIPSLAVGLIIAAGLALALAQPEAMAANTVSYTYDAWGRVTSATYQGSGRVTTGYGYDPAGNRTQVGTAAEPSANPVALVVVAGSSANPVALSISGPVTRVSVPTGPGHGAVQVSGTSITYTPGASYAGPDSFTYTASNSAGTSPAVTVQVAVAPLANAVAASVPANSANNPVTPSVVAPAYTVAVASLPSHGTAAPSSTGPGLVYTPAAGYWGPDSFQYAAANAVAASPPATVSVTVETPPPTVGAVNVSIPENSPKTPIPLVIGGGTPTSVAYGSGPGDGTATVNGLTISYQPNSGYVGPDSFSYTASNNGGTSSPATVQITVTPFTAFATLPANCPPSAPTGVCGSGASSSNTFSGQAATCTATGGTGPYSYAWTLTFAGPPVWTSVNGTTSSTMTPEVTGVHSGTSGALTTTCTATDSSSPPLQSTSNQVTYRWFNNSDN